MPVIARPLQAIRPRCLSRGRHLLAALAALRSALADARGGSSRRAQVNKLLVPLPTRKRMPVSALQQPPCAAFAGHLAMSMGLRHHLGLPTIDAVFLDAERMRNEITGPFDSGTAIAGCERHEVASSRACAVSAWHRGAGVRAATPFL